MFVYFIILFFEVVTVSGYSFLEGFGSLANVLFLAVFT